MNEEEFYKHKDNVAKENGITDKRRIKDKDLYSDVTLIEPDESNKSETEIINIEKRQDNSVNSRDIIAGLIGAVVGFLSLGIPLICKRIKNKYAEYKKKKEESRKHKPKKKNDPQKEKPEN